MKLQKRLVLILIIQVFLVFSAVLNSDLQLYRYTFLFTDSFQQIKSYYPNFFLPIFIICRFIAYVLPFLLILLIALRKKTIPFWKLAAGKNWWLSEVLGFFGSLIICIIAYYINKNLEISNSNFQLDLARGFISLQVVNLIVTLGTNHKFFAEKFKSFLSEPVLPYSLSMTRILFFSFSIFLYLVAFPSFEGHLGGEKQALPTIEWLVEILPVSPDLFRIFCYLGAFCAFMVAIGYKTRFFLICSCITIFYVATVPNFYGKLWHQQLVIWITWILAFSPCYDILSIDAKLKSQEIVKSWKYGLHLKILFLQFGLIYFFPGFYKLWAAGFDWALGESMVNQVHLEWFENYNKVPAFRLDKYPSLLQLGGILAICFELLYFFLVFSKKTRWIAAIGGILFHNLLAWFMHIGFFLFLQVFYLVYIPWNKVVSFFKELPAAIPIDTNSFKFSSLKFIIPFAIVLTNFIYGVFRIDSYPFSIYPTYSNLIEPSFSYLKFDVKDKEFAELDLWARAKDNYFRWESFSRFEPEIVDRFRLNGTVDSSLIAQQWERWHIGLKLADEIDSIEVSAIEILLKPELQEDTLYKEKMMLLIR